MILGRKNCRYNSTCFEPFPWRVWNSFVTSTSLDLNSHFFCLSVTIPQLRTGIVEFLLLMEFQFFWKFLTLPDKTNSLHFVINGFGLVRVSFSSTQSHHEWVLKNFLSSKGTLILSKKKKTFQSFWLETKRIWNMNVKFQRVRVNNLQVNGILNFSKLLLKHETTSTLSLNKLFDSFDPRIRRLSQNHTNFVNIHFTSKTANFCEEFHTSRSICSCNINAPLFVLDLNM